MDRQLPSEVLPVGRPGLVDTIGLFFVDPSLEPTKSNVGEEGESEVDFIGVRKKLGRVGTEIESALEQEFGKGVGVGTTERFRFVGLSTRRSDGSRGE